ncbi:MAG: hypothetical protein V4695_12175 [Pseudomonadota bacterium]
MRLICTCSGGRLKQSVRASCASVVLVIGLLVWALPALATQRWPSVGLPEGVSTYAIGERMVISGMPMRLTGFVSPLPPKALTSAFRRSLGEPVVENVSGNKQVLGRALEGFYVTVQIEARSTDRTTGSQGTIAVVDMESVSKNHEQQRVDRLRLLDRLPAGSSIASDMASDDQGKSARHIVIVNTHGQQRNREAVVAMLGKDGYVLEREVHADASASRSLPPQMAGASTLYFKAAGKEAMAVITRTGERTAIVLNTVATLQAYK